MSEVKVNKISPRTGTDVELNSSAKITNFTSTGIDDNADATAITIDSSENVLVKKTSVAYQTVGHELKSDGRAFHTADGGKAMSLVRKNSDGSILDFYIDGTEEGSIQVAGGGTLALGAGNTFLRFQNSDNTIRPTSNSGFSNRDNAIDLGASNARWNDLYLGGNIYLGGTGSANALDDYEEGTWSPTFQYSTTTPSFTYTTRTGRYTKIGRVVMINFTLNLTSIATGSASGDIQISGLPFTSKNPAASGGGIMVYGADVYSNAYDVSVNVNDSATLFTFIQSRDNEGWINLSSANDNGQLLFHGSFFYDTDS